MSVAIVIVAIAIVAIVIGATVRLSKLKRAIVSSVPTGVAFFEVDARTYPQVDAARLAAYTAGLERLGFANLGEFTLRAEQGIVHPGIARIFIHPDTGCFAEVNQLFPPGKAPVPLRCVFGTLFEQGWSLASTDREPSGAIYLLRQPKLLWQSVPGASLDALYSRHVALADRISNGLRIRVNDKVSLKLLFDREFALGPDRRATLERTNILTILYTLATFPNRPKYQWMGDFRRYNSLQTPIDFGGPV